MNGQHKFKIDEVRLAIALNYLKQQTDFMKWSMYDRVEDMYEVILMIRPLKKPI